MSILGLHHITLVTADAQRCVDFYSHTLGLRFIKQTVNFDDPGSYHLYFGDGDAKPGSVITFFEWRGAPQGRSGIGGTHHLALTVADWNGLLMWKRRLTDRDIKVAGPFDRRVFASIYFDDPDGTHLEITTAGPGWTPEQLADTATAPRPRFVEALPESERRVPLARATWPDRVDSVTAAMTLTGMHHISAFSSNLDHTHAFYGELLGMKRIRFTGKSRRPGYAHWFWGAGDDAAPGTLISYFEQDPAVTPHARIGAGQTHHFALAVKDEAEQMAWREKLVAAGQRVSPVMDRVYFKSIYTTDPDGHIVELATLGPGFFIDEDDESLGRSFRLPPWYEPQRALILKKLRPLTIPAWQPPRTEPAPVKVKS